ncbi:hypothetical protein G6F46_008332 [Rhizopus delemar]|uniref:Uncharacterized protein n=2 Tax=Rhizopus TaxID=4842 RepID=A0A9P6YX10_9FUNG|nr:hypothetical protein G6F36_012520 [Rhizopus arrhizus]KAG1453206.1 hypothetical protein G6F55_008264 [Rhizopus delemar]KAG1493091.1 hypothetical protein G6F54_008835 [Rhizopus delemar]KAG1507051.1 hypothetical protein G6F53_009237 [Rhizopus delemar]KAG1540255.1 hypothetical protein G6F51_008636 [Rhizopus arrhizus]
MLPAEAKQDLKEYTSTCKHQNTKGDTIYTECKRLNLDFKLDLRFIAETNKGPVDISNGEFAKVQAATKSKYYSDKLKAILTAKCHLNHLAQGLQGTPKGLKIPIIMVMGIDCHVFSLSLIDRGVYILQQVLSISYPRMCHQVSKGGIAKLLDGFAVIEDLIDDTINIYDEYSKNIDNIIDKIDGNSKKKVDIDKWLSPVIWDEDDYSECSDTGEDEED